ncbi:MAG: TIGR00270 family protein [Candidatus Heimdallarchaeota archaeon]|nr:TIGR00270 family protein [Candidatus Heimdallarchaeota archaeon]
MSCEMCGKFAGPDLVEAEVDGVSMFLCRQCSKFGTKPSSKKQGIHDDSTETEVTFVRSTPGEKGSSMSHIKVKTGSSLTPRTQRRPHRDALTFSEDLIDNYGEVIKEARKSKGLSLEDFAQLINEKASLLQKIEKSEFNPPDDLVTKIERKLDISLKEEIAAPVYTGISSKKDTTLGDVVKLKKKKYD